MSFHDEIADLIGELAEEMLVPAFVVSSKSVTDAATDKRVRTETLIPCRAVLGSETVHVGNGVIVRQAVATVTIAVKQGDRIRFPGADPKEDRIVDTVTVVAPTGKPLIWKAVLK